MIAEKPRKIKVFQGWASKKVIRFRVLHLRPLGQLSVYVIPHFFRKLLERTDGKNNKIFNFRTEENPEFMVFLSGANSQLFKKFLFLLYKHIFPLFLVVIAKISFVMSDIWRIWANEKSIHEPFDGIIFLHIKTPKSLRGLSFSLKLV